MPSFDPSLGTTTLITIPSSDRRRFAHLTFQLSFGQDEDDSGSWEIWTDLALVGQDGERIHGDGAWHAMKFERDDQQVKVGNGEQGDRQGSAAILRLQGSPLQSESWARSHSLQARGTILASPGSCWSYTFRRVLPNGEVHWLGQEGGNGVIRVENDGDDRSSSTPRTAEDSDDVVEGVAISLPNTTTRPVIHVIPSDSHVQANIVILTKTVPAHVPFYTIAYDAQPPLHQPVRPVYSVSIAPKDNRYEIPPGSVHPQNAPEAVSYAESAAVACESAIRKADATDRITMAAVSGEHASGIHAFYVPASSECETEGSNCYLLIFGAASPIDRLAWIARPARKCPAPLVAIDASGHHVLINQTEERLPVLLSAGGTIAKALDIQPFHQLRGTGDRDSIWVCLPGVTSIEVGEEEINSGIEGLEDSIIVPSGDHALDASRADGHVDKPQVDIDGASVHTEATPELEESIFSRDYEDDNHASKEPALWILKLVGRFLLNLLHAVWSTFGFGQKTLEARPRAGSSETDETEAGARTPVDIDERTPLLQSEMSRSTTASGPLSDLLAPKDGMMTPLKEVPTMLVNPQPTPTDLASPLLTPIERRVQIRSYLRFFLPSMLNAYQCLLFPDSTLKDRVKGSTLVDDQWKVVEVLETPQEGQCTEVQLVGVAGGSQIEIETVQ